MWVIAFCMTIWFSQLCEISVPWYVWLAFGLSWIGRLLRELQTRSYREASIKGIKGIITQLAAIYRNTQK